jgi:hypothetical protein
MKYQIKIAGRDVSLEWSLETQRRFLFRLSSIGGHPKDAEMRGRETATAAMFKILWALLPQAVFVEYKTPEDLFVAFGDDEFDAAMDAIRGVYSEMDTPPEKKRSSKSSPSRG